MCRSALNGGSVCGYFGPVHDALVTLGLFSIFQLAVDMPFVAAILTIMGYSINATIVVFDRSGEPEVSQKERLELANASISQTLIA